ncbi:hypothetical protein L1049_015362 [Liquidambar formosana]|uniref:YTH domain-containing family protein n=1 Tax=Liquidambar formosana TaxID=63359 RepID=A0AAP0S445_LIQFO
MAGEKKIEKSEPVDTGLKSDPYTVLADQEAASGKDGMPSDSTLSISSSGDGPTIKDVTDQESVAEQGYSGACTQLDDRGYLHADGSYTGVQSDNGSLVYYLPGYNPYATGNLMGVDGQCINQQPYFSSSGYLQHPVSYGSEAGPCYSWDSTFVGDAPNGTGASLGNSKSGSGPTASAKSNGFNSMKTNGMIAGKFSTLPVDSKSRQVAATSNFSKSIHQTPPHKSFNKVPQLGSDFSGGVVKGGFHPVLKFPSFMNQKQGLFPYNDALNHRPNGRTWNGNDRFKLREKSNGNAEFEASTELTCGPRACNRSALVNSADEKEVLGFTVRRDQYNLQDFPTEYEIAKFYVIKSYNEDNIHRCVKYDVWSSTPNGNKKLDAAFHDAEVKASETGKNCPIFLFFSVNGSGQFVGLAEMIGPGGF